ncbi:MAG: hypothetical protein GF350_03810 [Chitinivibrionales bacterium]|nr:hypothetical protein [Chitinivibrionales bacterium]
MNNPPQSVNQMQTTRVYILFTVCTLLFCAYRDNPADPQSPHFQGDQLRVESISVSRDTVYAGDTATITVTVNYSDGSSKKINHNGPFTEPGLHYITYPLVHDSTAITVLDTQARNF